jgi:acid stress-induced BolA-like protein IbaG/YrbA
MLSPIDIKNVIQKNMQCEIVEVKGDDGAHFEAIIVSNIFESMTPVRQHQAVYKALDGMMKEEIHALSIKTFTTFQWEEFKNGEK